MPNIKSAEKRMRSSEQARQRNKVVKTRIKNVRRTVQEISPDMPADQASEVYKTYCSVLDKAAKTGVIKRNTAIRRKRRAAERLRKLAANSAVAAD